MDVRSLTGPPSIRSPPVTEPTVIEGRLGRRLNNALILEFRDGPGDPFGTAVQGGGDGIGRKLGVLFGFKNGGAGTHTYTPVEGSPVLVESRERAATLLTRSDGSPVGQIERGPTCIARRADGAEILHFTDDPAGAKTLDAFRLIVTVPNGDLVAHLHVIRTIEGWSLGRELVDDVIWWGRAGQPLRLPLLGTSLQLQRPLTPVEREIVLAACVDLAIGLRPYGTAMG